MAEDILKAVRVLAARAVDKKEGDYLFRHICRWYSKEFHTPLAIAESLPLEELLQHYFECKYEDMDEEELAEEIKLLIETDAEREAREKKEAEDKEADEAFFQAELAKARQALDKTTTTLDKLPVHDNQPVADVKTDDKSVRTLPPDIKMTFVDEEEMEEIEGWDLLGDPGKGSG